MMKGRNYHIVAGTLLVAGLFWFSVTMGRTFVAEFTVPLNLTKMPRDLTLAKSLPETVEISLEGLGWQLLFLSLSNQLSFDLSGRRLRTDGVVLTNKLLPEALNLPPGVKAIQVFPDTLLIAVDPRMEKKVPVHLKLQQLTFETEFGLTGSAKLSPDSVVLTGARRVLRSIDAWATVPCSYERVSLPVVEEIAVMDSLSGIVRVDPGTVTLFIPVEQLVDVLFTGVAIDVQGVPVDMDVLLETSAVDVYIRGGVNTLANLSPEDFSAMVEYTSILADTTGTISPHMELQEGLSVLRIEPPSVSYTIRQ